MMAWQEPESGDAKHDNHDIWASGDDSLYTVCMTFVRNPGLHMCSGLVRSSINDDIGKAMGHGFRETRELPESGNQLDG